MASLCDLQAVVVSSDPIVLDSISSTLKQFGIAAGIYQEKSSALQTVNRQKTDAFFVDGEADPEHSLLKAIRSSNSSRGAVGFAIVPQESSTAAAFRVADFVMDKPLALPRLRRTLHAAYGIMLKERLRYYRHSLRTEATVLDCNQRTLLAQTSNISQTGIGLECPTRLSAREVVQLQFSIPDNPPKLHCKAQVIWTAEDGKAGLTFTEMTKADRERLASWIEDQFHRGIPSPLPATPLGKFADANA